MLVKLPGSYVPGSQLAGNGTLLPRGQAKPGVGRYRGTIIIMVVTGGRVDREGVAAASPLMPRTSETTTVAIESNAIEETSIG